MFNDIIGSNYSFITWDCQKNNTPLVINGGNVYWTDLRVLDRDVIVQSGNLYINCEVRFVNDCKITLQSGASLSINGGKLTNLCGGQWAGIESQGNVTIDNSTIEHALTAVSRQAGYFRATNTIFENNMRDIEYLDKPTFPITDIHKNCTFRVTNSYRGSIIRSRVTMWNSRGIFFNGCDFINQHTNPYQLSWNLQYDWQGIYAVGSGFEVNKNTDNNKKCTFTNFSTGIRVAYIGTSEVVNIIHSDFNQNDNGVISEAVPNIYIKDNKFNVNWYNSFPHSSWYSTGLYINTGSGFTVRNNEFTGFGNGGGQYTFGTLISETGESDNLIEGNKYANLYVSNRVLFKNTNNSSSNPMGLQLFCSNHSGNVYDHTIEGYGNSDAGIRLKQGSADDPDGNQFSNNSIGPDIWTDTQGFERFYQDLLALPRSLALPYDPHIFMQTLSPNQASCSPFMTIMGAQQNMDLAALTSDSIYATKLTEAAITELTNAFETTDAALKAAKTQHSNLIDGGNSNGLLNNIRSRWNRDTAVLRSNLLAQSPNLSTTVLLATAQLGVLKKQALMQLFLANPSACREPKFIKTLKQDLPTLLTDADIQLLSIASVNRSNRYDLEEKINTHSSNRAEIGKLLINHYLTHPDANKQQLRYWWGRLGSRHALYNLAETYITDPQSNRYEAEMRQLNSDLADSEDYVKENQDYIELYSIKSKILKSGRDLRHLNESEIASLRRIANNARADAAVQANNILCFAIGECRQFDIPRLAVNSRFGQRIILNNDALTNSKIKENVFRVYPNPTSGSLTIDFNSQNPFTEGVVSLIDLTGKTILSQKIANNQERIIWQTEQLKLGLYFVIAKVDNQVVYQTKVSIQK